MDNLWQKVENIVANGEIARFEQIILLSLCFLKVVCYRGVRKRLYECHKMVKGRQLTKVELNADGWIKIYV